MGQEAEKRKRLAAFRGYCVDGPASPGGAARHRDALPPRPRGEEIRRSDRGPHSAVFDEAENRLHVQMAVLEKLIRH